MKAGKDRDRAVLRFVAGILAISLAVWALIARKDQLVERITRGVEAALSRGSELDVRIGNIHGRLFGAIDLENIEVREPWMSGDEGLVLRIREMRIRYRLLDFLSKKWGSKISVTVKKPELHWRPHIGVRSPHFPFMEWMREWALSQRQNFVLKVEDLSLVLGRSQKRIDGIDINYEDNTFSMEVPMTHVDFYGSDVTTVFMAKGYFDLGTNVRDDVLMGQIHTEGTVVNWSPMAQEANFEFIFTESAFRLITADLLGGIGISGRVDFTRDLDMEFNLQTRDYPIKNLSPFFKIDAAWAAPGRLDLEARFKGMLWQPHMDCRARFTNGHIGQRTFKALDLNLEGAYPTMNMENSRILMEDGTSMRFAKTTLEVGDLFRAGTYERLVAGAEQDSVVWGDWELSRPLGMDDQPEFLMQRLLGKSARIHFKAANEDEQALQTTPSKPMEVGFEYRLKGEDSLKFNVKDDEEFIGVEHKTKF